MKCTLSCIASVCVQPLARSTRGARMSMPRKLQPFSVCWHGEARKEQAGLNPGRFCRQLATVYANNLSPRARTSHKAAVPRARRAARLRLA
eukprot:scaffold3761_cov372-Prasinococcus_capsulatus_cf.AAC.15